MSRDAYNLYAYIRLLLYTALYQLFPFRFDALTIVVNLFIIAVNSFITLWSL